MEFPPEPRGLVSQIRRRFPGVCLSLRGQYKSECDQLEGDEQYDVALEWAARIHHRFERIHPFQDGNGRAGRVIAAWMLLHYGLPPFEFGTERRDAYIDALAAADEEVTVEDLKHPDFYNRQTEALQPLIDFMVECLLAQTEPDAGEFPR